MTNTITSVRVDDIRYPTASRGMAGSDPRHFAPDYSCARVSIRISNGRVGHSVIFTCGEGTEIVKMNVQALADKLVGKKFADFVAPSF